VHEDPNDAFADEALDEFMIYKKSEQLSGNEIKYLTKVRAKLRHQKL